MAWGRRCDLGCATWPDQALYVRCPECGGPTSRASNLQPLDEAEAESILLHKQFDVYYERWCSRRGIPVDGPLEPC